MGNLYHIADNGDGTYTNPILHLDYSDPDAIRVGNDYYMVASSFTNTPGLPLLHSNDLVNWKVINYCIKNVPEDAASYKSVRHGCGVWAPSIRFHEGTYYVCFPLPDEGIYMTTATDPYGEWSEPVNIMPGKGNIDPCPFWDDDGKAYLINGVAKSRIGFNNVLFITQMAPDGLSLIGKEVKVYDGNDTGDVTTEGPKLYKRNGYYYIFAPAGGVKPGYQVVMRSSNIYGPYEKKIVLKQGTTDINGPHQGAWVDTVKGEDWFIHFRDVFAAGRITYLEPMKWENDWPIIGEPVRGESYGEPVKTYRKPDCGLEDFEITRCYPECSDKFLCGKPNTSWQWNANHEDDWICIDGTNGLKLKAIYDNKIEHINDLPNLLLQKWPAPEMTVRFKLDLSGLTDGDYAGVVNLGANYSAILFRNQNGVNHISFLEGTQVMKGVEESNTDKEQYVGPIQSPTVYIKYSVERYGYRTWSEKGESVLAPSERVSFYASNDGVAYIKCFEHEAMAGRWVGVKFGPFASSKLQNSKGLLKVIEVKYS